MQIKTTCQSGFSAAEKEFITMRNKLKALWGFIYESRIKAATTVMCLALCAANLIVTVSGANTVKIYVNGEEHEISTHRTSAEDILNQSGIEYDEETDFIDDSLLESYGIISLESVSDVTIIDGDKTVSYRGHGLVSDVIKEAGIEMGDYDEVEGCSLNDYVTDGLEIKIKRAFSVTISADGDLTTVYMCSGTVADALNKAVITYDDDDIISHPLDEQITQNSTVKLTRIEYVERTDTQEIKYSVKEEKTATLNKGQSKIKQKGVNGEKTLTYTDKYVDGELSESTLKDTQITKEAVEEIKLVGTKSVAQAASAVVKASGVKLASGVKTISVIAPPSSLELTANNTPASYKKKYVGTASAYYGGGRTATGKAVKPGYVAVNPRQIPYHTAMWIVSNDGKFVYGYSFAEDTGGFTKWTGNRATLCDLYMNTYSECARFGRRGVTIYVL